MQKTGGHSVEERVAALLVEHELAAGGSAAAARVYEKTFAELAPLLGARGVHAIFARSVELVRPRTSLLASLVVTDEPAGAAAGLIPAIANAPADEARGALVMLHAAFFGLIVTFVGADLTAQVLRARWPDLEIDLKETA